MTVRLRDEDVQEKLVVPDARWGLVVDEAHRMSAVFFGGEVKYTKRNCLGQLLSTLTRHYRGDEPVEILSSGSTSWRWDRPALSVSGASRSSSTVMAWPLTSTSRYQRNGCCFETLW